MVHKQRRAFLQVGSASVLLTACRQEERQKPVPTISSGALSPGGARDAGSAPEKAGGANDEKEVGAVEDLMREHGIIRRVLVVYREAAARLRVRGETVSHEPLRDAATLIRDFAEDYHEKQLEEEHIFPAVKRRGGRAGAEIDTLVSQHQRGREISAYILSVTRQAIGVAAAEPLGRALEGFARMYEEHAAREDTITFPAWKQALSAKQLDEMGELFEEIEHRTFGKDGFDDALEKVTAIEHAFGLDPSTLMPPPPPRL